MTQSYWNLQCTSRRDLKYLKTCYIQNTPSQGCRDVSRITYQVHTGSVIFFFFLANISNPAWVPSLRLGCFLPSWLCTFSWRCLYSTISWLTAGSLFPLRSLQLLSFQLTVSQVYFHRASALTAVQQAFTESAQENWCSSIHFSSSLCIPGEKNQRKAMYQTHHIGTYKQNHNFDTSRKNCNYIFMGVYYRFLIYLVLWSVNCFAMNIHSKKTMS